jgi:lipopolysaccharide/colanic/teichoic acid biosynthesis glycosyltransferase
MPVKHEHRWIGIKYFFDKVFALLALLLTSPIFLIVAIVLKLIKQDVFYLQKRVGYKGKDFLVYKFTTMPKGSEKLGYITTTNDARPFKFGKFLRKTKINELPQLINVLLGSMSMIGPRPLVREQIASVLSDADIEQYYSMRPGITGAGSLVYHHEDQLLAQFDDPFKYDREIIMPHKQHLEARYVKEWSLGLDLKILLLTILVVLKGTHNVKEDDIFCNTPKKS